MENANHTQEAAGEEAVYVYHVYGMVPEFMPHFAFRREKHFKTAGRKIIKCPHCGHTFTTIDATDKVKLYRHPVTANVACHKSMACRTCRQVVGIVYKAA